MRRSARWMVDNWSSLDHEQMQVLMADPLAYDIEDQLIASAKEWGGDCGEFHFPAGDSPVGLIA